MRDVTTTELADAPRCFGTGLARAPVIEPSWTPMMRGSAWLQDVKPRGATGPRFGSKHTCGIEILQSFEDLNLSNRMV